MSDMSNVPERGWGTRKAREARAASLASPTPLESPTPHASLASLASLESTASLAPPITHASPQPTRKDLYFNTDMTIEDLVNAFEIVTPITDETGIVKNAPSLFAKIYRTATGLLKKDESEKHTEILQRIDTYFKSFNMYIAPIQTFPINCDSPEDVIPGILGNTPYYLSIDLGEGYTTYNVSFNTNGNNIVSNITIPPGWVTRFLTENMPVVTGYLENYGSLVQALGQQFYTLFMRGLPTQEIVLYFIIKPVGGGEFDIEINRNGCTGSSIKIASTIPPIRRFTGGVNKMKRSRKKRSRKKRTRKKRTRKKRTWKKRTRKKRTRKRRN
tara:strand:+ start:1743 stop:2729 length:987 start_codon:yes stop_codon:yes gene_type:complete